MEKQYRGYIIASYEFVNPSDQEGPSKLTRWRVCEVDNEDSEIKRILRDGFVSEAGAKTYVDKLHEPDNLGEVS